MTTKELRTALGSLVERHGFRKVSRLLGEMEPADSEPRNTGKRTAERRVVGGPVRPRNTGVSRRRHRPSAVSCVERLELGAERAGVVGRAAAAFDEQSFLPILGDIRVFCETYGIEEPLASSRDSRIPRIFRFLGTMNPADLERILDDRMFSGPARLAPIADAIRRRAKELREARRDRG